MSIKSILTTVAITSVSLAVYDKFVKPRIG